MSCKQPELQDIPQFGGSGNKVLELTSQLAEAADWLHSLQDHVVMRQDQSCTGAGLMVAESESESNRGPADPGGGLLFCPVRVMMRRRWRLSGRGSSARERQGRTEEVAFESGHHSSSNPQQCVGCVGGGSVWGWRISDGGPE